MQEDESGITSFSRAITVLVVTTSEGQYTKLESLVRNARKENRIRNTGDYAVTRLKLVIYQVIVCKVYLIGNKIC